MLDWFTVTCGGAALYAAGKIINAISGQRKRTKHEQRKKGKYGQPLRLVVAQCEARWFLQDLKLAMDGDTEAMARVAHMLISGYGTQQDHKAAAQWMRKAWAIQNYKEPAQLQEMLDVRDSPIPTLNEASRSPLSSTPAGSAAAAAADHTSRHSASSTPTGAAASSAGSAGGPQAAVPFGQVADPLSRFAACQLQLQPSHIPAQALARCGTQAVQHEPRQYDQPQAPALLQQQQHQQPQQPRRQQQREQQQQLGLVAAAKQCRRLVKQQQRQRVVAAVTHRLQQRQLQQQQQQVTQSTATAATAAGAIT